MAQIRSLEGKRYLGVGYLLLNDLHLTAFLSAIDLIGCVNNFLKWTDASIADAIGAVTTTPATMLGLSGIKGTLDGNADADFVILAEEKDSAGKTSLAVEQVWKFGTKVADCNDS